MKCGFYEREITPPLGCDIPGYYQHRYAEDVLDRLYVKAVVFCDDSGAPESCGALLVADAVELHERQANAIIRRASAYTGIPENNISVSANHTHLGLPVGDVISDEDQPFMEVFCRMAADCVTLAYRRMVPCRVSCGVGQAAGISHVRDYQMADGNVATNARKYREEILRPNGEPDTDLPVLSVYDESGKALGCLYSFACHQDCVGGLAYSGDYSGVTGRRMKARYGEDFVSLYLPGASGDINHMDCIAGIHENYVKMGEKIAEEAIRLTDRPDFMPDRFANRKEILPIPRRHASEEELKTARWIREDPKSRRQKYDMTGQNAKLMLLYEESFEGPEEMPIPIHVFRVGDARIFSLPGELYSVFGNRLKDACPGKKGLVCELSNIAVGYIPPKELYGTAAYPVQLCHGNFLEADAGDKIVKKALEIAETL